MNSQFIDFEGNFGSQDPALQPTEADFTALSAYLKARRAENEVFIEAHRQGAAITASSKAMRDTEQAV